MDTTGTHLLLEYWCCDSEALATPKVIESAMLEAAEAIGATVLKSFFHKFDPSEGEEEAGVSGVIIIAESHLSIHTWPDRGYAAVDVYTCGDCKPHEANRVLRKAFRSGPSEVLTITRGISPTSSMRVRG